MNSNINSNNNDNDDEDENNLFFERCLEPSAVVSNKIKIASENIFKKPEDKSLQDEINLLSQLLENEEEQEEQIVNIIPTTSKVNIYKYL
jgi:hypothetical protein